MLTSDEVNSLGQIIDTTWGRSSTAGNATISVKTKMAADKMTVVYSTYATFPSNVAMSQQMPRLNDEGQKVVDQYLKTVKEEYKKVTGKALKTKLLSASPSVEVVSLQPHVSPKRTILFRYIALISVE